MEIRDLTDVKFNQFRFDDALDVGKCGFCSWSNGNFGRNREFEDRLRSESRY